MARVVTFGEIMLRLSPPGHQRFVQAGRFDAVYGGGEANVAVSLAQFGLEAVFVSRVPSHEIGQAAVNALRRYGVHTEHVLRGGDRLGVYYLELGASQRPSKVIYDRGGSAAAGIAPGMIDWDAVLDGADWFHVTGITPALGEGVAEATLEALAAAERRGLTVSCDLNYRKKLWSRERAERVMARVLERVHVAIANEEDIEQVFGIRAGETDVEAGKLDVDRYRTVAQELMARFPGLRIVAVTLRESFSASDNGWSAVLWDGARFHRSRRYTVRIVDRVGGGDAFAAGLIYGLVTGRGPAEAVEFAAAASCLKHTIPGDANYASVAEVEALAAGAGSGRVER